MLFTIANAVSCADPNLVQGSGVPLSCHGIDRLGIVPVDVCRGPPPLRAGALEPQYSHSVRTGSTSSSGFSNISNPVRRTPTLLAYELPLGREVVRERPVELPDFVELCELRRGVAAEMAGELPGRVSCSSARRGHRRCCAAPGRMRVILLSTRYWNRCSLMNSDPVSELCR